jgi:hypothetical protein
MESPGAHLYALCCDDACLPLLLLGLPTPPIERESTTYVVDHTPPLDAAPHYAMGLIYSTLRAGRPAKGLRRRGEGGMPWEWGDGSLNDSQRLRLHD